MRKTTICIGENKAADQLRGISFAVTAKLISAFVFATWIVQSLFYLNTKFPASNNVLWLYSPVCVGPGLKPKLLVFSCTGSLLLIEKASELVDQDTRAPCCIQCLSYRGLPKSILLAR